MVVEGNNHALAILSIQSLVLVGVDGGSGLRAEGQLEEEGKGVLYAREMCPFRLSG